MNFTGGTVMKISVPISEKEKTFNYTEQKNEVDSNET